MSKFIHSLLMLLWMITTAALGSFSLALAPHAPNPDYEKAVFWIVFINILCVSRLIYLSMKDELK